ncbi:hypothetical protein PG989_012016 [Apiospora arundinis]
MHASVQALLLEGYTLDDDPVCHGINAIERFTWQDDGQGKRLQFSVSPVWDTAFMVRRLCAAGVDRGDKRMRQAIKWIKSRQALGKEGDWRIYGGRSLEPEGFSFEYNNRWYPDVDDTTAVILAIISQDPLGVGSSTVARATIWICGMQNRDGGWVAFDVGNDKLWLNKIPFSDMDGLCDPSSADKEYIESDILDKISLACTGAIGYLTREQEQSGAWYGRWGANYLFSTSNVLCGLSYFSKGDDQVQNIIVPATSWLKQMQNADGGWGEDLLSYRDASLAGKGPSTPSQTAWVLLVLLATCGPQCTEVLDGISHLVDRQADITGSGASWPGWRFTGTGFPNHFCMGFSLYRHYFPMMVLGKCLRMAEAELGSGILDPA